MRPPLWLADWPSGPPNLLPSHLARLLSQHAFTRPHLHLFIFLDDTDSD